MKDPEKYLEELKTKGLDPQREERFRAEIAGPQRSAEIPPDPGNAGGPFPGFSRGSTPGTTSPCCRTRGARTARPSPR